MVSCRVRGWGRGYRGLRQEGHQAEAEGKERQDGTCVTVLSAHTHYTDTDTHTPHSIQTYIHTYIYKIIAHTATCSWVNGRVVKREQRDRRKRSKEKNKKASKTR